MKLDPILTKATRLAGRGNFGAVIKTLEIEVGRYHGSFRYYYLLAVSCLHVNDFGGAFTYFKLAREVKMRDPQVLLGMAVLYLRRGDTDKAVDYYLEVQELDEKNKTARKALEIIRRYAGTENLSSWIESGRLHVLYPPLPPAPVSWSLITIIAAASAVFIIIAAGILIQLRFIESPFSRGNRSGIEGTLLSRQERDQPVETGGSYRYILTRTQVLNTYERALSFFSEYRDEQARFTLNQILESNASEPVKNKARLIISYMEVPGFDSFVRKDNFSYSDVSKEPALYRDCHVIWKGMATNVDALQSLTAFDFLVGYDTRKTLEGIVPVVFDKAVALNPEKPLEVLGRIVPVSTEKGIDIRLEGLAIHQSGLPAAENK
jgi:tetratricopeptide (TPR) repeat protein